MNKEKERQYDYVLDKPQKVKLWQKIQKLGTGCIIHKNGLGEILFGGSGTCYTVPWYERKHCKRVPGWRIMCDLCSDSVTMGYCKGHKIQLETEEVIVLSKYISHDLDHGYGYVSDTWVIYDKSSGEKWAVGVDNYAKDWSKITLQHIKENGFKAKKDII